MRSRGFTLVEMLVVSTFMGLVISAAFLFFSMGARGFNQALARTGAVGEVHVVTRALERDIKLTHFYSVAIQNRVEPESTLARDGLCLAGLSSWSDSSRFEVGTGLPKWDRWICFYATPEKVGRLVRLETERHPPSATSYYPLAPIDDVTPLMENDPVSYSESLRVGTLSSKVHSFSVQKDPYTRLIKMRLVLLNAGGQRLTSGQQIPEFLESEFELAPLNSYPDL